MKNMNVKFNYIYRDASNFKSWGSVTFGNPGRSDLAEIDTVLLNAFGADRLFIASQIRIPEIFLYNDEKITIDDHCFHEFVSVNITNEAANDQYGRAISEFIEEIKYQSDIGWAVFDPSDPYQFACRNKSIRLSETPSLL